MNHRTKSQIFLISGLGIVSGILLTDRFIVSIPDWIAIVLLVFALSSFFLGINYYWKSKK